MILITRLNGVQFALNPDLIERAEATPDTVVTLVDGTKYVILETLTELMDLARDFRATVVATAHGLSSAPYEQPVGHSAQNTDRSAAGGRVVSINRREP